MNIDQPQTDHGDTEDEFEDDEPVSASDFFAKYDAANPEFKEAYDAAVADRVIAEIITGLRVMRDLTQKELAERVGKQQPAIARIESAGTNPSWDTVASIMSALNVDIHFSPTEAKARMIPDGELQARLDAAHKQGFAEGMSSAGSLSRQIATVVSGEKIVSRAGERQPA